MTSLFYVALECAGLDTIVLSDGVNYSISDESGWLPNIVLNSRQTATVDAIPINILGATVAGGESDKARVRVNYTNLMRMLNQIEGGQNGDGGLVKLVYTSPNSAPARRIACQVIRVDESTLPTDINAVQNLITNEINEVVLTLEHRVPWVWATYIYPNLLGNSAWNDTPNPAGAGVTLSHITATGYYGGMGKVRAVKGAGVGTFWTTLNTIPVTSGVPITITFTVGTDSNVTLLRFYLAQGGVVRSNIATVPATVPIAISAGERHSITLTPTITGNVEPSWEVSGAVNAVVEVAEVYAGVDTVWHRTDAEEGKDVASAAGSSHPIDTALSLPGSPAMAETKLTVSGFPAGAGTPTALGEIFTCVGAPAGILYNYPRVAPAGVFTDVADAARLSLGGTVMRFTPGAASTFYPETAAATPMITAMGSTMDKVRQLQAVLVCVNNSATATFSVYVQGIVAPGVFVTSRTVDIPPNGADPIHVILPPIFNAEGFYDFRLYFAATIAGQTFDVDRAWCFGMNEETSISLTQTNYNYTQTGTVIYDPMTLTSTQPALTAATTAGGPIRLRVRDTTLIRSRSTSLRVAVDALSDGLWQVASGGVVAPLSATVYRPPAFDAPL